MSDVETKLPGRKESQTPGGGQIATEAVTRRRLPWLFWALNVALLAFVFVLGSLQGEGFAGEDLFFVPMAIFGILSSSTVGAMVASRQPRNPIGWLFLLFPLGMGLGILSEEYPTYAVLSNPGSLPGPQWVAWAGTWAWLAAAALPLILILFPTGRVPSPRWRWVPPLLLGGTAWAALFFSLDPRPLHPAPAEGFAVPNPVGVEALRGSVGWLIAVGGVTAMLASAACIVGLVVRFRRARGDERQQLRWLVYVGAAILIVFASMILLSFLSDPLLEGAVGTVMWSVFASLLVIGIPVASGVAILKFRLYDLDVVIKKTVVFGLLAAFVTLMYVLVVVGLGTLVTGADTSFNVLFFAAIAVIALVLQPLRGWARRVADRLVYGRRATPYEILSEFTDWLGQTYSVEDVVPRMAELITAGTGATRAEVWLRIGGELRLEAASPAGDGDGDGNGGGGARRVPLAGRDFPEIPGATRATPVRQQDELLGAIAVQVPASDPLTPEQERLLAELAAQAGLVLRNVRLIEELRASRQRLVAAQDAERRRIERNLHDGAQQQLVALAVKARLAEQLAERDPGKSGKLMGQVQMEAEAALEDLRNLARGIYPPLLAGKGLAAALEGQARKAAVPVEVEADAVGRYRQEVEAAVYFCVLEALQNVIKYARESRATVLLEESDGHVEFAVRDEGPGFDPSAVTYGTGLQGMADRLDALGGSLRVDSSPGQGALIRGRIPIGQRTGAA